jgi:rRNA processing protein Krr1/Pno1
MKTLHCRRYLRKPGLSIFSKIIFLVILFLLAGRAKTSQAVFVKEQLDNKYYINIILILDCSASMNKIIGPVRKVDIAKKTVETIISGIAEDSHDAGSMQAGLRVFGSKFYKWKQNCDDTNLEVALNEIEKTRAPILMKVNLVRAKGQSALTLTMGELKKDFPDVDDQINFIVVVSDGDESCGGSPCAEVKKLVDSSKGVSVSTLGVETTRAGYDNLNCMAQAGNGLYFDSKDVENFVLFLKDANQTIQKNRRTLALQDNGEDSSLIALREVTQNLAEHRIDDPMPLYPGRDERFPTNDTLRPDDKLFLIQTRGLWMEVFAPEKQLQGWILAKKGGSEYSVTVAEDKTPFYKERSPSSQVLAYLDAGEQLTLLEKDGEWYKVFSNKLKLQGWVTAFNVVGN